MQGRTVDNGAQRRCIGGVEISFEAEHLVRQANASSISGSEKCTKHGNAEITEISTINSSVLIILPAINICF